MSSESVSRRQVLVAAGAGLTASLSVGSLLPGEVATPVEGSSESPTLPDNAPLEEVETPYAVFQHKFDPQDQDYQPTAPINVVFPLTTATFTDVIEVFQAAGWYANPVEFVRYAYDRDTSRWMQPHWSGATSVIGVTSRLHVRCWELAGTASIQAHVDTPPLPRHRIDSYVEGRRVVEQLFADAGWAIDPDDPERTTLGNVSSPDHDGEASVIEQ